MTHDDILERINRAFDPVQCMADRQGYPLPAYMKDGVVNFVFDGLEPGSFLYAVLCNDLKHSVINADQNNKGLIVEWALLMYNGVPVECQGNTERVAAWINKGGLKGKAEL